jgi:hypothetical protein
MSAFPPKADFGRVRSGCPLKLRPCRPALSRVGRADGRRISVVLDRLARQLRQACRQPLTNARRSNCCSLDRISHVSTDLPVVPICRGRTTLSLPPNHGQNPGHPAPAGGAYRDRHGRAGCDGRFGGALTNGANSGRRSRVVLTPRRWRHVLKKLTLLRGNGGKKARFTGESTKEAVKTIAQGRPACSGEPVWRRRSCAFSLFAREAMGASGTRLSLRPLFLGRVIFP